MEDPFDKLPDEVYQLIFHAVADCKSLVRCMAVSRTFREHSERVSELSIVCPGQFSSYVEKLQRVFAMVRRFPCLEVLVVRVGQPKDEPPSWARCMRYAEIGASVEKFVFMAAKTGEFSDLDSALRGVEVAKKEKKESSSEGEGESSSSSFRAVENRGPEHEASSSGGESEQRTFPDFSLRQVVAPSNDVLKRMVPVIVFAIVQGLDEFRDSVPAFIHKFKRLRTFLLVDMLESVTVFMREHQIEQIRSQQQQPNPAAEVFGDEVGQGGEDERNEMSMHDRPTSSSEDRKGKGLEGREDASSDKKLKGKKVEEEQVCGESSSVVSLRKEDKEDEDGEEVTSPLRDEGDEAGTASSPTEERENEDGAETWRNCRGICIHGPGDSRGEFVPKYSFKRLLSGTSSSSRPVRGSRRRERSADWLEESVRRRQEYRFNRGLALRRRDESRAFRTWRLGKRDRAAAGAGDSGGGDDDDGSYSAQSVLESRRMDEDPAAGGGEEEEACSSSFSWDRHRHPLQEHQVTSMNPNSQQQQQQGIEQDRQQEHANVMNLIQHHNLQHPIQQQQQQMNLDDQHPLQQMNVVSLHPLHQQQQQMNVVNLHPLQQHQVNLVNLQHPLQQQQEVNLQHPLQQQQEVNLVNLQHPLQQQQEQVNLVNLQHPLQQQEVNLVNLQHPLQQQEQVNGGNLVLQQQQQPGQINLLNLNVQQQQQQQQPQYQERRMRNEGRRSSREAWRHAWRETWGERTGRRCREMRESEEAERRERLREGVRRRQMDMEREALRFEITFWRAEEVVASVRRHTNVAAGNGGGGGDGDVYRLTDVSMCVATHCSRRLSEFELDSVSSAALAGPLLAATIALVNQQATFHNL